MNLAIVPRFPVRLGKGFHFLGRLEMLQKRGGDALCHRYFLDGGLPVCFKLQFGCAAFRTLGAPPHVFEFGSGRSFEAFKFFL